SLCDQRRHFAFTLCESSERSFCGAARREGIPTRGQPRGLVQEMITERCIWNGGCQFLDQFLRSCKGNHSLLSTTLILIQLSQVDGNAPEQWSQPLRMSSVLRGSQRPFCFCFL